MLHIICKIIYNNDDNIQYMTREKKAIHKVIDQVYAKSKGIACIYASCYVAISILKILFSNVAIPSAHPSPFFRRIKRFIAFLALLLYVCINDWACLVYSRKANPRRKSLFIKERL